MKGGKTGYLGPKGTYSEIAAEILGADSELIPYPSFFTLFAALERGELDKIVLPIENSLNGAVTQNLDLLQDSANVFASAACTVRIEHRLITKKGVTEDRIRRVYSHPQALAQCAGYLAAHLPQAELHETSSTADCIKNLLTDSDAGIVGAHVKAEGYELSEACISDEPNNFTQFLSVRVGVPESVKSTRVFFSVTCRHEAGALVGLLGILKDNGINMTEIESRPIKDRTGEFRFFIEIEGDYADPKIRRTLDSLKDSALSFKLLGAY